MEKDMKRIFASLPYTVYQISKSRRQRALLCAAIMSAMLGIVSPAAVQAATCTNLVTDSSLEDGSAWTTKSKSSYSLLSDYLTHTGEQAAYLAGANQAYDMLATTVKLPAAQQSLDVTFWWQIQSQESGKYYDNLTVLLVDPQGKTLQNLATLSSRDMSNQWQQRTLDISNFAGQTVQLQFVARTDAEAATDFFLDDIEIVACN
jgi:hypothetical protein